MKARLGRRHIRDATTILAALGLPEAQQNERSALCLLALLDLSPKKQWGQSAAPLIGITPIMDWVRKHYQMKYAPNTRETIRRETMHQFALAGIAVHNPDKPDRPVNSPQYVYQIDSSVLKLIRTYGSTLWQNDLAKYLMENETLASRYAMERKQSRIPVKFAPGKEIALSPGEHSKLIRDIIEEFGSRFVPGGTLIYAGDTGDKWGYFDENLLSDLGVSIDPHGKMPDVVIYSSEKNWVILAESVTSHGPVDGKRHEELTGLFSGCKADLVFVTAFPDRTTMGRYLSEIAWETEVWVAEAPSHLIHFNGEKFLGPYEAGSKHS